MTCLGCTGLSGNRHTPLNQRRNISETSCRLPTFGGMPRLTLTWIRSDLIAKCLAAILVAGLGAMALPPIADAGTLARGKLPLTSFYETPTPLPFGNPGDLIRSEVFDGYDLPPGTAAMRFLYHSRAADSSDVAASAVVLLPDGDPPTGGWPVVAWAHPVNAVAQECGPSLLVNLHRGAYLGMFLKLGYAIVATDYAGLGTSFRNAFLDMQSNAADVVNSVRAAHHIVPNLAAKWVAIGEREGGLAVIAVAETQDQSSAAGYLGGIVIAGLLDPKAIYEHSPDGTWQSDFAWLGYGVKTIYPAFSVSGLLTTKGLGHYEDVSRQCTSAVGKEVNDGIVKPGWEQNSFVAKYLARNVTGNSPSHTPLLVIQGRSSDWESEMATQIFKRMCGQGDRVQVDTYPDLGPESLLGGSVAAQVAWLEGRFRGAKPANDCH